ncbi:glycosyl transferase [Hortaea werneckii]|uniref:Uncharacterized protein n=2 Tax=Hortaea werneckii TaxID=91943 RepID=A0A3M7I8T0_HORWE|nr:glycosyl transferase [Hortaea werneckii]OTA22077.1 hypothetical protein BTJ68_14753 [Hortaea werneckii EXF-2000]KAI6825222.1 glycosyl transferase [Hortaea werneckii]KAI6920528.1 glycosyl transferase [Hortaea werneckii]KAI6931833.1 glycosyl transferase [Hortaea werneckii]
MDPADIERGYSPPFEHSPSVENIVIPAHLLATVSDQEIWTPDHDRQRDSSPHRTDARRTFDIQGMVAEQQHEVEQLDNIAIDFIQQPTTGEHWQRRAGSLGTNYASRPRATTLQGVSNDPGYQGRKTSLPTILRTFPRADACESDPQTQQEPDHSNRAPSLDKGSDVGFQRFGSRLEDIAETPEGGLTVPVDQIPEGTVLFKRLSSYNLLFANGTEPKSASRKSLDDQDSMDPHTPTYFVAEDQNYEKDTGDGLARLPTMNPAFSDNTAGQRARRSTLQTVANTVVTAVQSTTAAVTASARRTTLADIYEKAKVRKTELERKKWVQIAFEVTFYLILLCFIYFVLIGVPLWRGAVWWLFWVVSNKFVVAGTWSITIGLAVFYAYAPLLILFEKEPPMPEPSEGFDATKTPGVQNTALLIPCYKSARIIGPTLEAALKIFPANHIYVIANGNSPTPLDNTEEVCRPYGVNHIWSPVGSKIVAQFVGCYAAKHFENVLLIDDDCALPPNFPIVSDRMKGMVKCIGYTIKSVGPNSSKGTLCQQAQDLEYKISGLQRAFAGNIGSATFPHGAISLWNTRFLIETFHTHPGFSVSEDWFFGHVARQLGCRIRMCTAIFVETETPTDVFVSGGGSRGGFGEMTIFKQRFYRWNFFFVNGMYYNMAYILGSWKLGWWEIGAKLFVWQEVYETLLYLLAPFVLPISFIVRPDFCGYLMAGTFVLYYINVIIFNEIHLRLRNERVGFVAVYLYYAPYKIVLTAINILSCYYSLYKYARYFAKRHPKVIEDERAVEVVLRLEEQPPSPTRPSIGESQGRRMTVTAVGMRLGSAAPRPSLAGTPTAEPTRPSFSVLPTEEPYKSQAA